jgi:hypothetical protein
VKQLKPVPCVSRPALLRSAGHADGAPLVQSKANCAALRHIGNLSHHFCGFLPKTPRLQVGAGA